VQKTEDEGHDDGGYPKGDEAGTLGGDVFREAVYAACEGVLEVAAQLVLFGKADKEKAQEPLDAVEEDGGAEEDSGVKYEQVEGVKDEYEKG